MGVADSDVHTCDKCFTVQLFKFVEFAAVNKTGDDLSKQPPYNFDMLLSIIRLPLCNTKTWLMVDITNIRAYDELPLARRMFSLDLFPQCHIVHQPEIKAPAVLVWKPEKLTYCHKVVVPGHIAGIRCFS